MAARRSYLTKRPASAIYDVLFQVLDKLEREGRFHLVPCAVQHLTGACRASSRRLEPDFSAGATEDQLEHVLLAVLNLEAQIECFD